MPSYDSAIPNFANLTGSASANIQDLLAGSASPNEARLDNAWYGAGTGLDTTSPFLANRGRALYGQRDQQRKQSGIDNFLKMLQSFSGTVVPTAGQELQNNQFQQNFGYRQQQDLMNRNDMLQDEGDLLRAEQSAAWNAGGNWNPFMQDRAFTAGTGISSFRPGVRGFSNRKL